MTVDATDALASIDGKFDENQNIAPATEGGGNEYNTTPMIDLDTGIVIDDAANEVDEDVVVSVEEMKEALMGNDATFTGTRNENNVKKKRNTPLNKG